MLLGRPLLARRVHDKDDRHLDAVLVVGVGVLDGGGHVGGHRGTTAAAVGEKYPLFLYEDVVGGNFELGKNVVELGGE